MTMTDLELYSAFCHINPASSRSILGLMNLPWVKNEDEVARFVQFARQLHPDLCEGMENDRENYVGFLEPPMGSVADITAWQVRDYIGRIHRVMTEGDWIKVKEYLTGQREPPEEMRESIGNMARKMKDGK